MKPLNIPDDRRAAVLIAKFLQGKIKNKEEVELDRWIVEGKDRLELFNMLTSTSNIESSAKWFAENGVNPGFLKEKPFEYYKPTYDPREMRRFYILMALGFLGLLVVYLMLRFL